MNKNIMEIFLTEDDITSALKLIKGEFTMDELIQAFCDKIIEIDDKSFLEELVTKLVGVAQRAILLDED